jgi:hypothetical protein
MPLSLSAMDSQPNSRATCEGLHSTMPRGVRTPQARSLGDDPYSRHNWRSVPTGSCSAGAYFTRSKPPSESKSEWDIIKKVKDIEPVEGTIALAISGDSGMCSMRALSLSCCPSQFICAQ